MYKTPTIFAVIVVLAGWSLMTASSQEANGEGSVGPVTTTADGYKRVEAIDMSVQWKVIGDDLEIVLSSPTTGWLAVGFDPSEIMMDADIYIGVVHQDGSASVRDDFGTWFTSHEPDTEIGGDNDATVSGGSESAEGSTLRFRIPLESGDEYDAKLTPGGEHVMMLAYGADDDIGKRHRNRIKFTVTL